MKALGQHEVELLVSLVRWEKNLIATASAVVGSTGSGVITWVASHDKSIVGDWWHGEDLDKAIASVLLFFGFGAVYIWQCVRLRNQSKKAQALLVGCGAVGREIGNLVAGNKATFLAVTLVPILLLFGILVAILT